MTQSTAPMGGTSAGTAERQGKTRRRSAGEGSVYEEGGRWRGAMTWTDPLGKHHRIRVSGATSNEARKALDKRRRELAEEALTDRKGTETVGAYLARWIERNRPTVRAATWRAREQHVRVYLIPTLGKIPLRALTAEQVELALGRFLREGRPVSTPGRGRPVRPVAPLTANHVRGTLRRALNDAIRDGKVTRNAAAAATPVRVPRHAIVYLPPRDVRKLLEVTAEDVHGPLYALAVTTGLRMGELLGLAWGDLVDGRLTVRRSLARAVGGGWALAEPKSPAGIRTIPLPLAARQALETERTRQLFRRQAAGAAWRNRDGLVFTDELGRPLQGDRVSNRFRLTLRALGLPRVRFHDLRHTAATLMLAQGVPLTVVSKILGHSGIGITDRAYAAVVPELFIEAADAMDRAIGDEA